MQSSKTTNLSKPPLSDVDILRSETLSSDMFSPHPSLSHQPSVSSNMATMLNIPSSAAKTFLEAPRLEHPQARMPFQSAPMAHSLFQRRTNSPFQMALSETGSGSSPGSIDSSPILSPNSPFDTIMNAADAQITNQAKAGPTRFNFKAAPFFPTRHSPIPLGWKGPENCSPFKYIRSESPVEPRQDQPFGNVSVEPPPMNRMLKSNFPMQTLPLPYGSKSLSSSPQDIPNFQRNSQGNFLQQHHHQRNNSTVQQQQPLKPYYNSSNSGRSSPFPFPQQRHHQQQPAMGPHGDSFSSNFNKYGQQYTQAATYSGSLKQQQGFSSLGNYQRFPNSGSMFSMQQQQQQLQVAADRETPTGKLHQQLDECCIHVKRLEEERKKVNGSSST